MSSARWCGDLWCGLSMNCFFCVPLSFFVAIMEELISNQKKRLSRKINKILLTCQKKRRDKTLGVVGSVGHWFEFVFFGGGGGEGVQHKFQSRKGKDWICFFPPFRIFSFVKPSVVSQPGRFVPSPHFQRLHHHQQQQQQKKRDILQSEMPPLPEGRPRGGSRLPAR